MIKYRFYFLVFYFVFSSLSAEVFKQNKIDQDPWVKFFSFLGPFKNEVIANKAIEKIFSISLTNSENFQINNNTFDIINVSSEAGNGVHYIHQLYSGLNEDDIVLGVANIFSDKNQVVAIDYAEYLSSIEIFFDGSKVGLSKNDYSLSKLKIKKGLNTFIVKIKNKKKAGFYINLYPESRIEINGTVTDNKGLPIPFADIYITNNKEFNKNINCSENGKFELLIDKEFNKNDKFFIFCNGRQDRVGVYSLNTVKAGGRIKLNLTLKERQKISGKVYSSDGKKTQYKATIKLLYLNKNGTYNDDLSIVKHTNQDGEFNFKNLIIGDYHLATILPDKIIFELDDNGNKKKFVVQDSGDSYEYIKIKVMTQTDELKILYFEGLGLQNIHAQLHPSLLLQEHEYQCPHQNLGHYH